MIRRTCRPDVVASDTDAREELASEHALELLLQIVASERPGIDHRARGLLGRCGGVHPNLELRVPVAVEGVEIAVPIAGAPTRVIAAIISSMEGCLASAFDPLEELDDTRPRSSDSEGFGQVPMDYVRGRVEVRLWPRSRVGTVR